MTAEQTATAEHLLAEYRTYLAPVSPARLLARITTLLAHYWEGWADDRLREGVALDWADDLGEYPGWAIDSACRSWRRTETRKPTPADIRQRCCEETAWYRTMLRRLEALTGHRQDWIAPPTAGE